MPGIVSSHGTSGYPTQVLFGNVGIGYLTDFDVDCQAGQVFEATHVSSPVHVDRAADDLAPILGAAVVRRG